MAVILLNLAMTWVARGAADKARQALLEALDIVEKIGSRRTGQSVLEVAASLAASRKSWERAARLYGAAEAQLAKSNLRRGSADEAFIRPLIEQTRAALGGEPFGAAEAQGRASPYEAMMLEARGWLEGDLTDR